MARTTSHCACQTELNTDQLSKTYSFLPNYYMKANHDQTQNLCNEAPKPYEQTNYQRPNSCPANKSSGTSVRTHKKIKMHSRERKSSRYEPCQSPQIYDKCQQYIDRNKLNFDAENLSHGPPQINYNSYSYSVEHTNGESYKPQELINKVDSMFQSSEKQKFGFKYILYHKFAIMTQFLSRKKSLKSSIATSTLSDERHFENNNQIESKRSQSFHIFDNNSLERNTNNKKLLNLSNSRNINRSKSHKDHSNSSAGSIDAHAGSPITIMTTVCNNIFPNINNSSLSNNNNMTSPNEMRISKSRKEGLHAHFYKEKEIVSEPPNKPPERLINFTKPVAPPPSTFDSPPAPPPPLLPRMSHHTQNHPQLCMSDPHPPPSNTPSCNFYPPSMSPQYCCCTAFNHNHNNISHYPTTLSPVQSHYQSNCMHNACCYIPPPLHTSCYHPHSIFHPPPIVYCPSSYNPTQMSLCHQCQAKSPSNNTPNPVPRKPRPPAKKHHHHHHSRLHRNNNPPPASSTASIPPPPPPPPSSLYSASDLPPILPPHNSLTSSKSHHKKSRRRRSTSSPSNNNNQCHTCNQQQQYQQPQQQNNIIYNKFHDISQSYPNHQQHHQQHNQHHHHHIRPSSNPVKNNREHSRNHNLSKTPDNNQSSNQTELQESNNYNYHHHSQHHHNHHHHHHHTRHQRKHSLSHHRNKLNRHNRSKEENSPYNPHGSSSTPNNVDNNNNESDNHFYHNHQHFLKSPSQPDPCDSLIVATNRNQGPIKTQTASSLQPTRHAFQENMFSLRNVGWYWGPLSFTEAERLMDNRANGTFLIRDSGHDTYFLSLTFRVRETTYHTRIEYSQGTFSFWSQPESHSATTIVEFIDKAVAHSQSGKFHYFLLTNVPGQPPMEVSLLYPLSRYQIVHSLKHLSRFVILNNIRRDHISVLNIPPSLRGYLMEKQYYITDLDSYIQQTQDSHPFSYKASVYYPPVTHLPPPT